MTVNRNNFINYEAAVKRCMSALIFKDDSFLILPYWPNSFSCGLLVPLRTVIIYKTIVDLRYLLTEAILGKRKAVPFSTTVVYNGICLY